MRAGLNRKSRGKTSGHRAKKRSQSRHIEAGRSVPSTPTTQAPLAVPLQPPRGAAGLASLRHLPCSALIARSQAPASRRRARNSTRADVAALFALQRTDRRAVANPTAALAFYGAAVRPPL